MNKELKFTFTFVKEQRTKPSTKKKEQRTKKKEESRKKKG